MYTCTKEKAPRPNHLHWVSCRCALYRVSLKKGNSSFWVHYSIITNYFFKNVHIIGKLIFSSFIWHHNHDGRVTHDWAGQFVLGMAHWHLFKANKAVTCMHTLKTIMNPNVHVAAIHLFWTIESCIDDSLIMDNFKYFGFVFDPQLTWSNHIDQLTSNVSKRIGIIQTIKYYLPSSTLNLLGNALVMPLIDYCSSVWSNCNVQYSNSLQILHNRLARILLSADSRTLVNDLMTTLSWNKLEQRWNDQLLITTFKCLQGNAPSYLSSNFLFSDSAHSKGTRSQTFKCLLLPPWKTNPGRRSFHFRAANRWNKLTNDIRLNFSTMTTHI